MGEQAVEQPSRKRRPLAFALCGVWVAAGVIFVLMARYMVHDAAPVMSALEVGLPGLMKLMFDISAFLVTDTGCMVVAEILGVSLIPLLLWSNSRFAVRFYAALAVAGVLSCVLCYVSVVVPMEKLQGKLQQPQFAVPEGR